MAGILRSWKQVIAGFILNLTKVTSFWNTSRRPIRWFQGLPFILRLTIAGVILVLLLTLLSPLVFLVSILAFGVCIIVSMIRITQRESVKGWSIATGSFLIFVLLFGTISGALYGFGSDGGESSGMGDGSGPFFSGSASGDKPEIIAVAESSDAWRQAYHLCHRYFIEELAEELGTSEDAEEIAIAVGESMGRSQETAEAAYTGCLEALEEEAVTYLPATEDNIIRLVEEEGLGEPAEPWGGRFYISEEVDLAEIPDSDIWGKPTDLDPNHWYRVEWCSPSGRLYVYHANPWSADVYQDSSSFNLSGDPVC